MTAQLAVTPEECAADPALRGRVVESAVGAHLANAAAAGECELFYWRTGDREVDFVVRIGRRVIAIEVKSGQAPADLRGMDAFRKEFEPDSLLLVGGDGVGLEAFLSSSLVVSLHSNG